MIVKMTAIYKKWITKLGDFAAKGIITDHIGRFLNDSVGDVAFISRGIIELRIHYGAGYRIYISKQQNEVIILLCGGNKSTQERDINMAKKLVKKLECNNEAISI
ncbi:MAG: type II toxin-antitoxin system RelE/ParE family toxin [Gammaproteobacteria bacterium]|nr:type II toxin-antitoxin system RelE/ParE family toxin [Gammaproteobacteria bacterium]